MKAIIKCTLDEGETPASLARQCRSDDYPCPLPISGSECPVRNDLCEKVKASDWKRFIKNGATFKEG